MALPSGTPERLPWPLLAGACLQVDSLVEGLSSVWLTQRDKALVKVQHTVLLLEHTQRALTVLSADSGQLRQQRCSADTAGQCLTPSLVTVATPPSAAPKGMVQPHGASVFLAVQLWGSCYAACVFLCTCELPVQAVVDAPLNQQC